jgi:hypothetical protein
VRRPGLIAVLALAALAVVPGAASAAKRVEVTGVYNTRYCEVLELKGLPPDALVTVWNTIGYYKNCPLPAWRSLSPQQIAADNGDTAVIMNGPRYWLMNSIVGSPEGSGSFNGMRFHKVATISIKTNDQLVQAPYTERTITRDNVWKWKKGQTIWELVAPNAIYIMQSYSQIKDPSETIADLPSLGSRLTLPQGWSFRQRTLKKDYTLKANGAATILQDDLQNTYQLEPKPAA